MTKQQQQRDRDRERDRASARQHVRKERKFLVFLFSPTSQETEATSSSPMAFSQSSSSMLSAAFRRVSAAEPSPNGENLRLLPSSDLGTRPRAARVALTSSSSSAAAQRLRPKATSKSSVSTASAPPVARKPTRPWRTHGPFAGWSHAPPRPRITTRAQVAGPPLRRFMAAMAHMLRGSCASVSLVAIARPLSWV